MFKLATERNEVREILEGFSEELSQSNLDKLSRVFCIINGDEKRITELEAQIEKMKSQYDYAFTQLLESREIVCLMLSQYRNKKEINYSTRERGEQLLKQGVYKHD